AGDVAGQSMGVSIVLHAGHKSYNSPELSTVHGHPGCVLRVVGHGDQDLGRAAGQRKRGGASGSRNHGYPSLYAWTARLRAYHIHVTVMTQYSHPTFLLQRVTHAHGELLSW